jgi:uncharacterized protein (TIGR03084 family)
MTDLRDIAADLQDEQSALDDVVSGLSEDQWALATPSPGWSVADQIGHLTYFDGTAALAITDPDAFLASAMALFEGSADLDALTLHRDLSPADLLAAWRENRRNLRDRSMTLEDGTRVVWYGPPMSAKSFLTARLMECWAHGQDVVDAVGAERAATDRLRHIAQLGVITRGWTYANRGIDVPAGDVRLQLTAPGGDGWRFGPDDAGDVISGPALDFCLVVTQRRHIDDTSLVVDGEVARDWMEKAQAFAGAATDGPPPRR